MVCRNLDNSNKQIQILPVSDAQYISDNRVASTAFYKCFQTGSCNPKRSVLIRMKLLQIAYNATMLGENLDAETNG